MNLLNDEVESIIIQNEKTKEIIAKISFDDIVANSEDLIIKIKFKALKEE